MSRISKSAFEVQFDLRPAKQVERRMLLDAFQRLAEAGFSIRDHKYTGFGALHFVDFVIFHKLLGIAQMLSVEHDPTLEGRVRFNCPFSSIEIVMGSATDVIPTLSPDQQHILWLDYDEPVTKENLNDVYLAGSQLSSGSFLIVTVDVEPPVKDAYDAHTNKSYFKEEAGNYLGLLDIKEFTKENLYKPSRQVILSALKEGMAGRIGIDFHPLFYFLYKDGHRMMTLGGMIGSKAEKRKLGSMNKEGAVYLRMTDKAKPYEIKVPVFTRKERHLLDSAMPCAAGWQPLEFAIPAEHIKIYREIYRFLPSYVEILL
jgi:hypothetical protein